MQIKAKDFPNDAATDEWLSTQKKSTRRTYGVSWNHFRAFVGMSGDQILADRKNDKDYKWEKKVLASKAWGIENGLSENSAKTVTIAARSFFAYHRVTLQYRRTEAKRLGEAHLKKEDYRFSLDDLKKMFDVGDLQDRYVVTVLKSTGLRVGDFLRFTRGTFEPYIYQGEAPLSLGAIDTQKENVRAYPFLDLDAIPVVKLVLEKMTRDGRTQPTDRILTFSDEIAVTRLLKRLALEAGINSGNKVVRSHNLRKFLIDRLASVMSSDKWKLIIGKVTPESAYVSADSLRADYTKVMEMTCFSKNFDLEKRAKEIETLKQKIPEDVLRELERRGVQIRSKTTKGRRYLETEDDKKKDPCPKGSGKCQKIVDEANLAELLAEGWKMVGNLPSGKIVVSNEA